MMKLTTIGLLCLTMWSNFAFTVIDSSSLKSPHKDNILPYRTGRLLVKIREDFTTQSVVKIADNIGAKPTSSYTLIKGLYIYEFSDNIDLEDAQSAFMENSAVEYAEPDYFYEILTQNDPKYSQQWPLENYGQTGGTQDADINAESMWAIEKGKADIVIGVIDTGIDYNHQDLSANMWQNPLEIAGNNIDDDNNGYIDDVYGINAILNNGNPMDDNKHGTHVAGTIGAVGNNELGVVGVAQNVRLAACKFLSAQGSGSISDAIECMQYFAKLKMAGVNLIATNNSWGGGSRSQAMEDGIKAHRDLGILFVAAAGNESSNNDTFNAYPANYQVANVISVAATDANDRLASFSNYGIKTVHVGAPGVKVLSTVPNNGYAELSGTSMATPHVVGLAAIIKAYFPSYDYKAIKNLILSSGTKIQSLQGKIISERRIRGADTNGTGALTCENQIVKSRLLPADINYSIAIGNELLLSAVHLNCGEPAGDVVLLEDSLQSVVLKDDGLNGDAVAGDGIYSLLWKPVAPGTYPLDFGNNNIVSVTVFQNYRKSYQVDNSIIYQYENFQGQRLNAKDETMHVVTSPFSIHFGDDQQGFTTLYVSSNGTISFTNNNNPGYKNMTLPNPNFETLITLYWDDLINSATTSSSDIYVETLGQSPNRKFIVEWWNMKHYNATGLGTFQAVFYENSSDVRFNFQDTDFGDANFNSGKSATVGMQTQDNKAKLYSLNTASIPNKTSLLFTVVP